MEEIFFDIFLVFFCEKFAIDQSWVGLLTQISFTMETWRFWPLLSGRLIYIQVCKQFYMVNALWRQALDSGDREPVTNINDS